MNSMGMFGGYKTRAEQLQAQEGAITGVPKKPAHVNSGDTHPRSAANSDFVHQDQHAPAAPASDDGGMWGAIKQAITGSH